MKIAVTASQMKQIEQIIMEKENTDALTLMDRASASAFDVVSEIAEKNSKIAVFCGGGNNGGDGLALALILKRAGYSVCVCGPFSQKFSHECEFQYLKCRNNGIVFTSFPLDFTPDIIVDAIFGTGLSREPEGIYRDAIEYINSQNAKVVSLDVPSGISADSGEVMGAAVCADITVTFGAVKRGLLFYPAAGYAGEIVIKDIDEFEYDSGVYAVDKCDLSEIPKRKNDSNKGSYGRVFTVAGSPNMPGAAYLSAKAAYRSGAGLVNLCIPAEIAGEIHTLLPEAITSIYNSSAPDLDMITEESAKATVTVIGPGHSRSDSAKEIVNALLLSEGGPLVCDADCLNIISENTDILKKSVRKIIVTPHMVEMARLVKKSIDEIKKAPAEAALDFASEYGVICVLKDSRTVTALPSGGVYINTTGNCGMAKAGAGDVLTGIMAALIAQGMAPEKAAYTAVCLHGAAGDNAAEKYGKYGILASDIANSCAFVLRDL